VKEHTPEVLKRQWGESCAIFGQGPDLYQIHSATPESAVLENEAVLRQLAHLRESGVQIGLSLSGPSQAATLRQAMGITRDGKPLFSAVQATWNLLEPSAGKALAEAHSEGYFVVIKEALANGRLSARNPDPELRAHLSAIAQRQATSTDALCLSAALAQPWADIVLSGAATVPQLQSNLAALHLSPPDPTLSDLAESPDTYWTTRKQLPWN
ncbi:MAG: aldo/keto reductase, partial [Bacteroidetes bacterium]